MICPDSTRPNGQEADKYGSANSEFSDLMAELKSYQPTASAVGRDSSYGCPGVDGAASAVRVRVRRQPLEISPSDWDMLFRAVEERLKLSVGAGPASTAQGRDAPGRVQAVVLECVAELEKLHIALKQERRQHDEGES
ncbi:hypothetical protein [Polaromonas sp.]|uniref:hypothetical protein n=1 Tax=Polaromonas sp. TaxID=1869339 RepID=UPI0017EA5768|nr:hypothetical protein [Polaromonas sp.]NMM04797.1 hypothetical protein [Polaromonas sp.]